MWCLVSAIVARFTCLLALSGGKTRALGTGGHPPEWSGIHRSTTLPVFSSVRRYFKSTPRQSNRTRPLLVELSQVIADRLDKVPRGSRIRIARSPTIDSRRRPLLPEGDCRVWANPATDLAVRRESPIRTLVFWFHVPVASGDGHRQPGRIPVVCAAHALLQPTSLSTDVRLMHNGGV